MAFGFYKQLTLNHTQAGSADSTNWPLTIGVGSVQVADADLKLTPIGGVQSALGYDIRPYSDSALTSALTYELVYYDGTNGKLEMHVLIPTLSHSADTVIYLAYGDVSIVTDGSSNTTWPTAFKRVFHVKDGTTLSVADSSQSAGNGTNHSATAAAGEIDGGVSCNGSSTYFDTSFVLSFTADFTLSGWFKTSTSYTGTNWAAVLACIQSGGRGIAELGVGNVGGGVGADNGAFCGVRAIAFPTVNSTKGSLNDGAWHFICGGRDTNNKAWISVDNETIVVSSATATGTINTDGSYKIFAGARNLNGSPDFFFNAVLDELRIATVAQTQSWITADYNSQKPSSTFITWGAQQVVGGGGGTGNLLVLGVGR